MHKLFIQTAHQPAVEVTTDFTSDVELVTWLIAVTVMKYVLSSSIGVAALSSVYVVILPASTMFLLVIAVH